MSEGALVGACPTCGDQLTSELATTDFNEVCPSCQEVGPKKMGRPRKRSDVPIHKTPGRSGYRLGCGCIECTTAHAAYHEAYNARKRLAARTNELTNSESAA